MNKAIVKKILFVTIMFSIVLFSGCSSSTRTVTFDSAGGSAVESKEVEDGTKVTKPKDPTRGGYEFVDWYFENKPFDFDNTNITKNITLKAVWLDENEIKYYTVKFIDYNESLLLTQIIAEGADAKAPTNPTREGYLFVGWDKDYTNITEDTIIKAIYEDDFYIISFNTNCDEQVEDMQVIAGTLMNKLPILELENGHFLGWFYQNILIDNSSVYDFAENITLEARWSIDITLVYKDGYLSLDDLYTDFLVDYSSFYSKTITKSLSSENVSELCSDSYGGRLNNFYAAYQSKWAWFINSIIKHRVDSGLSVITWSNNEFSEEASMRYEIDSFFRATVRSSWPQSASYSINDQENMVSLKAMDKRVVELALLNGVLPSDEINGMKIVGWFDNANLEGSEITDLTPNMGGQMLYAKWQKVSLSFEEKENFVEQTIADIINKYNGKIISNNLDFETEYIGYQTTVDWSSSNTSIISNIGSITRGSSDVVVTITIIVSCLDVEETATFTVTISKIGLKDISSGALVSSYVYNGTYNNNKVNDTMLATVDIIYSGFALPKADGSITMSTSYKNALNDYLDKAHNAGVRVMLCIGQEGSDYCKNFSLIARDSTLRATFVSNVINLINQYGFDGVDIDWEYPGYNTGLDTSVDKLNYTALMKALYTAVKANNSSHLVTTAIPAGPWGYVRFDLANSIKYIDYINLMSYDLECSSMGVARHHTSLYQSSYTYSTCSIADSVTLFISQGVPANKIIIGAAFYGRYSNVTSAGTSNSGMGATIDTNGAVGKTITYSKITTDYLNKLSSTVKYYWDDTAKAPYIYDSINKIVITYDDAKSIGYKCDYVVSKGVAGIMYWDNGSDNTGTLIGAINSKLTVLKGN